MKKFTKIMALTLIVIMSVMTLAACAKPAKDPEDAKKALEDNGYTVVLIDEEALLEDDMEAALSAYSKDEKDFIAIVWYKDSDAAKKAYDEAKDELQDLKDELEKNKDELGDDYKESKETLDNYVVGKSGNMVWTASSKDAVKAAK